MPIDDSVLRMAAQQLLKAARKEIPIVNFATFAAEENRGTILAFGRDGPDVTTIVFDRGGSEQTVLLQIEQTKTGIPKDARPLYPRPVQTGGNCSP